MQDIRPDKGGTCLYPAYLYIGVAHLFLKIYYTDIVCYVIAVTYP